MKSLINKTFDIFSSLKLTIFLFLVMVLYFAISTFIPQESEYIIDLSKSNPALFLILKTLGLFTPYQNFLIILVLFFFTFNLIACTLNRLPSIFKRISNNKNPSYFNLGALSKIDIDIDESRKDEIIQRLQEDFKNRFLEHSINKENYLILKKGIYSPLNFLFVHLSILIIVFGIFVSSIASYEGFIRLSEGRYEEFFNKEIIRGNYIRQQLPFKMKLNKFENITIANGMSVDYISDITIVGEENKDIRIRVNEPFNYEGILFVQSSYEKDIEGAEFTLEFQSADNRKATVKTRAGEEFTIFEKKFRIVDFYEDVHNMGAAVKLLNDDNVIFVLRDRPEIQNEKLGLNIYLEDFQIPYISVLRISYDPGTKIVFFGSIIFILSLLLVLFYRFNIVVIRLSKNIEIYSSLRMKDTIKQLLSKGVV